MLRYRLYDLHHGFATIILQAIYQRMVPARDPAR